MKVWRWPSGLRWARVQQQLTGSLCPLDPRSLKIGSITNLTEEGGRSERCLCLIAQLGLKQWSQRCWITCMAGERPSPECSTCPWVRSSCSICPQTEMAFTLRSWFPTLSPCCLYHPGGLILLYTREGKTASHGDPTQLSQCRSSPASKPNCLTSAQSIWAQILTLFKG